MQHIISDNQQTRDILTVCVIIPCYKDAKTIVRAIESVLVQTRKVNEIIVVNDCSPETDEIEKTLNDYPEIRYKKNTTNIGLAASRNVGIHAATCEVLTFLDADDELHPQKIELQLDLLCQGSVVSCDLELVNKEKQASSKKRYSNKPDYSVISVNRWLLLRNYITGASLMAPKQLLLDLGGYDESLRSCEDFDLWLRIISTGVIVKNISHPLYYYYYNSDSLSNNLVNTSFWETQVILKYLSDINKSPDKSFWSSFILFVWIIRHSIRFELCKKDELNNQIENDVQYLSSYPFFKFVLIAMRYMGVIKMTAFIKKKM